MNLNVWTEARYEMDTDGAVWTPAANDYQFWSRYLSVFDDVRVVARVCDVDEAKPDAERVDGPGVHVDRIPYYVGPSEFAETTPPDSITHAPHPSRIDRRNPIPDPSLLASLAIAPMHRANRAYGLRGGRRSYGCFWAGRIGSALLRPAIRQYLARSLRHQCRWAAAVAYVTENALQNRYPAPHASYTTSYSSVHLPPAALVSDPRSYRSPIASPVRLTTVASMDQPYKGVDVLIRSVAICATWGLSCRLTVVGDGRIRHEMEDLAAALAPTDSVHFVGTVSQGDGVRAVLDNSDIFVLASRTEGLPRSLVEAMARSLPAIASNVGGIPELLESDCLVPVGAPQELAVAIHSLASDPVRLSNAARRNLERARQYADWRLDERRTDFYKALRDATRAHDQGSRIQ